MSLPNWFSFQFILKISPGHIGCTFVLLNSFWDWMSHFNLQIAVFLQLKDLQLLIELLCISHIFLLWWCCQSYYPQIFWAYYKLTLRFLGWLQISWSGLGSARLASPDSQPRIGFRLSACVFFQDDTLKNHNSVAHASLGGEKEAFQRAVRNLADF